MNGLTFQHWLGAPKRGSRAHLQIDTQNIVPTSKSIYSIGYVQCWSVDSPWWQPKIHSFHYSTSPNPKSYLSWICLLDGWTSFGARIFAQIMWDIAPFKAFGYSYFRSLFLYQACRVLNTTNLIGYWLPKAIDFWIYSFIKAMELCNYIDFSQQKSISVHTQTRYISTE